MSATEVDRGVRVGAFRRTDLRATAEVLGEAFLDDPVWTAIGPRMRAHRRVTNRVSFAGILAGSLRHRARIRTAREGGEVVGATVAFLPGEWPMPDSSFAWELGWLLAAGPVPAWRGIRDDRAMRAQHVDHPHMYLWFLGVDPERHGHGAGRALLAELHEEADRLEVPTYLETATPHNVDYYGRVGYEVLGEIAMPSGPTMWRMERPVGAS